MRPGERIQASVTHFLEQEHLPLIEAYTFDAVVVHEAGWALSYHGTSHIGKLVALSKYENGGPFALSIVQRAVEIIRTRYPMHILQGVVSVPSTSQGNMLVELFAGQVATMLGLPYFPILAKTRTTRKQKTLTNSAQKEANVRDAFVVQPTATLTNCVLLLIDDIYDSGYTLQETGKILMQAGARAVYPFTITRTYHSDNQKGEYRKMDSEEQAYWLLLTFKSGLSQRVVHEIIQQWCFQRKRTLKAFFAATAHEWANVCHLHEKMVVQLEEAKGQVTEQHAVVEKLATHAVAMTTVLDAHYPNILKATLQTAYLPPILFYQGDLQLLEHTTIAIIGSRNAGELSLAFTRVAACYLAEHGANVISGYARGVDRAAYDGATSTDGCTTVVLPHGISRLSNVSMSDVAKKIECGKALLLSQFHPEANWLVSRAMARNKVVTGLAQIVIVAEANMHGGTWDAANGALEQKRPLYVCQAVDGELLAGNEALIERGGRSLYWSAEEAKGRSMTDVVLSPLLEESNRLRQTQGYAPKLSHQLLHMLKEHGVRGSWHP